MRSACGIASLVSCSGTVVQTVDDRENNIASTFSPQEASTCGNEVADVIVVSAEESVRNFTLEWNADRLVWAIALYQNRGGFCLCYGQWIIGKHNVASTLSPHEASTHGNKVANVSQNHSIMVPLVKLGGAGCVYSLLMRAIQWNL